MKIIVYSANINNYDYFYHPEIIDKNVKYILFTNNKYFKSNIWEVFNPSFQEIKNLDSRRLARFIKINPHLSLPEHDVSIWIDHCFKTKIDDFNLFLKSINFDSNQNMSLYKHSVRDCLYEEAKVCIEKNLDKKEIILNQIDSYKKENFPKKFGLFETGFLIRRNNDITNNFNNLWWQEVLKNSGRDQISQCYISWKLNFKILPINIGTNIYNNPFLEKKIKHV